MCAVEFTINLNGKDMSNIFLGELAAELQMLYVDVIQIHSLRDGRGYQMSLSVIDESVPATAKYRAFLGPIDVPVILEPELPLEHQEAHDPVGMPTGSWSADYAHWLDANIRVTLAGKVSSDFLLSYVKLLKLSYLC